MAEPRGTEMLINPDGGMRGHPEDLWFVVGSPDQLTRDLKNFRAMMNI